VKQTLLIQSFFDQKKPALMGSIFINQNNSVSFDKDFKENYPDMLQIVKEIIRKVPDGYLPSLQGLFNRGFIKLSVQ
jgi:hypothetical protein